MKRPFVQQRAGLWLIGAQGGVGTTATLGLHAIRTGLCDPVGLIGHLPPFSRLGLLDLDAWFVGGHEIRKTTFESSATELQLASGLFSQEILKSSGRWLRACDLEIRPGTSIGCGRVVERMANRGRTPRGGLLRVVETLADDIRGFQQRHHLSRVVVINVASTEPPFRLGRIHGTWTGLRAALDHPKTTILPASSLYALAAIESGAAYINFTPSTGIDVPALREYAGERGTAYMGADGKTGETLMKSVLAPMFAARNLRVLSWVGHNIFGNRDGQVLDDPRNKAAKLRSKDHLVGDILGYPPQTLVSIEYIRSLQDWKTAWDHVHFEGFLGTRMSLQFTWQGCDSILAAPLVLDLARLAEQAARTGRSGPLTHLASFFKSPMDVREQAFATQYQMLMDYARGFHVEEDRP